MITKKVPILILLVVLSPMGLAQTASNLSGSTNLSSTIVVPEYTDSQLAQASCDKQVWTSLVDDYKTKAQTYNAIGEKSLVANQVQGTPSPFANCFDQAASAINSAMSAFNTIKSILTGGGMDSQQLLDYAKKVAVGQACSQVNNYLASSGLSSSIQSATSGTVGSVLNTGTTIAWQNVSVGSVISAGGGSTSTGTTSTVTGSSIANTINPFK